MVIVEVKVFHFMQPGDVVATVVHTEVLEDGVAFTPSSPTDPGVHPLARW